MLWGTKLLTPFERISFTENQLSERVKPDFDKLISEAHKALEQVHAKQAKCYNLRRKEIKVNNDDKVLVETQVLSILLPHF